MPRSCLALGTATGRLPYWVAEDGLVRWSLDFGQVLKLGSPFGEDGPDGGQAEAVFG